jgi:hypothetical protein
MPAMGRTDNAKRCAPERNAESTELMVIWLGNILECQCDSIDYFCQEPPRYVQSLCVQPPRKKAMFAYGWPSTACSAECMCAVRANLHVGVLYCRRPANLFGSPQLLKCPWTWLV